MSEPTRDNPHALTKWVRASVVGDEPATAEPGCDAASGHEARQGPAINDEEMAAAKWFSILFLIVIIPLGLVLLSAIVWGFVSTVWSL